MNEIIRQLHGRKSVRAFEDRPVAPEIKRAILEAAMAAPTAGNQQMYTIIDVTDPVLKRQLSVTCDNQPFIADAPVALVFCADFQKWYDAFVEAGCAPRKPGAGDLMLAVTDTAIAAQNAVVAAHSFGLGSCYIGDIMENCELHRRMLSLPDYVFPAAMLVLGWPTQQQIERKKPERCALSDIVCENAYVRKDGAALRKMFAGKSGQLGFDEWAARFCARKYNSDFSKEMTRSAAKYLQSFANPLECWSDDADDSAAIITAAKQARKDGENPEPLPGTALVFFMGRSLNYLREREPEAWTERPLPKFLLGGSPVYVHESGRICMLHGGWGAPMAADTVETLAELGVKRIVCAGMCGGFAEGLSLGDIVLPDFAFAEEGTSRHYYERIETAEPSVPLLVRAMEHFPDAKRLPIVTTDAPYRQTFRKEALWRAKGAGAVEMETSAAFSVGRVRGVEVVSVLIVSDAHPLSPDAQTQWKWHMPKERREWFAEKCFDFAMSIECPGTFLETGRLELRRFAEDDFSDFCAFAMDDEMSRMMGRPLLHTPEKARVVFDWLKDFEPRGYALVLKETGRVIGNLTVGPPAEYVAKLDAVNGRRGCALSFSIGKAYQRKGLMTEALRAVIGRLLNEEGYDFVNCGYYEFNHASRGLQEKLGFEHLLTETVRFGEEEIVCTDSILWRK